MSVATATRDTLVVRPVHPLFGAEISGLDLRDPLDDETFARVRDAFHMYSVLVFRGQDLTDAQHIAFSRRFGELEKTSFSIASSNPYIYELSNIDDDGNVLEPDTVKRAFLEVNGRWHTDSSFREIPALGSLLSAKEVPAGEGDMNFASMRVAYGSLSQSRKASLEGIITPIHSACLVEPARARKNRILCRRLSIRWYAHIHRLAKRAFTSVVTSKALSACRWTRVACLRRI